MYFVFDEESEFHQRLNPVAMAKRQIPNGYKNTTKSLIKGIKPLKQNQNINEQEDYFDDDLFLFDEDAHARTRLIGGEQNRKYANKVKFVRADKTQFDGKGYDNFIKAHSTPRQYREHLRENIRDIKKLKKEMNTNPKYADYIKYRNPSYKNNVLERRAEGVRMAGASYDPVRNMIMINKSKAIYEDPLLRHKALSHELTHKNQFDMVKAKEGRQGVRRVTKDYANFTAKGTQGINNSFVQQERMMDNYQKHPFEYQAHKIGTDTNSLRDRKFRNIDPKYVEIGRNRNRLKNQFRNPSFRVDEKLTRGNSNLDNNNFTQRDFILSRFNKDFNKRYLDHEAKLEKERRRDERREHLKQLLVKNKPSSRFKLRHELPR